MSLISRLFNSSTLHNILSFVMPEIKPLSANLFSAERFYSKRYTKCPDCPTSSKGPKKPHKCKRTKSKTKKGTKCVPFKDTGEERKPRTKKSQRKLKKCKPGMKSSCVPTACVATCGLTSGKGEFSLNECPQKKKRTCPRGDWDRKLDS